MECCVGILKISELISLKNFGSKNCIEYCIEIYKDLAENTLVIEIAIAYHQTTVW